MSSASSPLEMYAIAKDLRDEHEAKIKMPFQVLADEWGCGKSKIRHLVRWAKACSEKDVETMQTALASHNKSPPGYYLCCQACLCRERIGGSIAGLTDKFYRRIRGTKKRQKVTITVRRLRNLELRESSAGKTAARLHRVSGAMDRLSQEIVLARARDTYFFDNLRTSEDKSDENRNAVARFRKSYNKLEKKLKAIAET